MQEIRALGKDEYPELLAEIPDQPEQLRLWGELPRGDHKYLAIVGSRKYSHYGREAVESLVAGLAGQPIVIVSGLALGIDGLAHRAALRAGLQTISWPGSGLDKSVLHPKSHYNLAEEIVESGGGLISEYDDLMPAGTWTFPQRNRLMAGMCHGTIVVEAEQKSGTLITSRLATEYNREVGVVPGSIFSPTSDGPHMLLRLGAAPIRHSADILEMLNLSPGQQGELFNTNDLTNEERVFVEILSEPCEKSELIRKSKLSTSLATATLSMMEIKGLIREELGEVRKTF